MLVEWCYIKFKEKKNEPLIGKAEAAGMISDDIVPFSLFIAHRTY